MPFDEEETFTKHNAEPMARWVYEIGGHAGKPKNGKKPQLHISIPTAVYFDGSAGQQTTNPGYQTTRTGAYQGYVVGGGLEYALTSNISLKAEYLHFDLGSQAGAQTNVGDKSSPIGYRFLNETSLRFDAFKVGANYRF